MGGGDESESDEEEWLLPASDGLQQYDGGNTDPKLSSPDSGSDIVFNVSQDHSKQVLQIRDAPDQPTMDHDHTDAARLGITMSCLSITSDDKKNPGVLNTRLYNLMRITSDKQDLSYVDKVVLPREEIFDLCNKLVPNSARTGSARDRQQQINFDSLNLSSLPTIGFYGHKAVMLQIFSTVGILNNDTIQSMREEKLQPGLHAVVHDDTLYVIYWHQGQDKLSAATRKDISCNFIRYLVELCDTVHICLDTSGLGEILSSAARISGPSHKKRTQKLKVVVVKSSENDVKMRDGFRITLPKMSNALASVCTSSTGDHGSRELDSSRRLGSYQFTEGFHQTAVLVAENRVPSYRECKEQKTIKVQEVSGLLSEWKAKNNVDVSLLDDKDFLLLLQFAHSEGFEEYRKLMKDLEDREEVQRNKRYHFDSLLATKKQEALEVFQRGAYAFLRQYYPSFEEALISANATDSSGIQDCNHAGSHGGTSSGASSGSTGASHNDNVIHEGFESHLEREICKIWTEEWHTTSVSKLLFVGSEVNFIVSTPEGRSSGKKAISFTIAQSGPKQLGCIPVFYGQEYLRVGKKPTRKITFSAKEGYCGTGPVLTSQPLYYQRTSNWNRTKTVAGYVAVHKLPSSNPMKSWIESFVGSQEIVLIDSYKRVRERLRFNVSSMVNNTIVPKLGGKVQHDLNQEMKALEEHAKDVKNSSIMNLRDSFAKRIIGLPTLSITSCSQPKALIDSYSIDSYWWTQVDAPSNGSNSLININYSTMEEESENMTWNIIELAPARKELEALESRPGNLLNPIVASSCRLIDIDSRMMQLSKVVYLKSGNILIFVEQFGGPEAPLHHVYLSPKLGQTASLIKTFKKMINLLAFEEGSKFLALYVKSTTSITVYCFDETSKNVYPTDIKMNLSLYQGSTNVLWMEFVPGKRELVLVDDAQCVRVLELTQSTLFQPGQIKLPAPISKACISLDGAYFIMLSKTTLMPNVTNTPEESEDNKIIESEATDLQNTDNEVHNSQVCAEAGTLVVQVYMLGTMSHLKNMELDNIIASDIKNLEAKTVWFGPQMHLLISDSARPELICSKVLESTLASEVYQLKDVQSSLNKDHVDVQSCPELDYVYHIFDKFSTSPPLPETQGKQVDRCLKVLLRDSTGLCNTPELGAKCISHMKDGIQKLQARKGKDFSLLEIRFFEQSFNEYVSSLQKAHELHMASKSTIYGRTKMGHWVRQLVCLVPIQIARAENNGLQPLVDGLQIPPDRNYADALSLAEIIQFGFYEFVLESWVGDIKVVSSMGKQSSGKSYLLNHLSGSLLDVAGGRCADGVWMTACPTSSCLYILLDFEGFGSFERSEQEDMLLSVLNAAISNITIFNKKDFHLDKETEAVFERFQSGVSLFKVDAKLFKGLFYMAIKDVDTADVEDLKKEFIQKVSKICHISQDNFLTMMYDGNVEIATMPAFQHPEFQESINGIAETIQELQVHHQIGRCFNRDLKLVIAQITAKDWSPLDSKRVASKVILLRKHLGSAISSGCLADFEDAENGLINFDTKEPIPESNPLQVGNEVFSFSDKNVQMSPHKDQLIYDILELLKKKFEDKVPRKGEEDKAWYDGFECFLRALAERRKWRVSEWLRVNMMDFQHDGDVKNLHQEASLKLTELQQKLFLCGSKCNECFLYCILERSHPGNHSCKGDHRCKQACTHCSDDGAPCMQLNDCSDVAGHAGPHDCQQKEHTCHQECSYYGKVSNCNTKCSLRARHGGEHKCSSRMHMCLMPCSLPGCTNHCVNPFEKGDHDQHACHENWCPKNCEMPGCNRNCASKNHFHDLETRGNTVAKHHFCEYEHQCNKLCEMPGLCEVQTELVKNTSRFQGKRSSFEYEYVAEQNWNRKHCCIAIPASKECHDGQHLHTTNPNAVHFCHMRCPACQYFCHLPYQHAGLHDTTHGNMRNVNFVSEDKYFEIGNREYTQGDSGVAEMCKVHCKAQGRGHIHLLPCQKQKNGPCAKNLHIPGARHEIHKYGPDFDAPKDEFTHAAYWKYVGFKDPCSEDDQRQFALCNHQCRSMDHTNIIATNSSTRPTQNISYCTEVLWHEPISQPESEGFVMGVGVSKDGHHFPCKHPEEVLNNIIFIIDRSGSMRTGDCRPSLLKFAGRGLNNRLGCVYEAISQFIRRHLPSGPQDSVSVVLFGSSATIAFECEDISEALEDKLTTYYTSRGRNYHCGLGQALLILDRSRKNSALDKKIPVIIFLSDGKNSEGDDPVELVKKIKELEPRVIFHTIKFGSDQNCNDKILEEMAKAGSGRFKKSLNEIELLKDFQELACSLRPKGKLVDEFSKFLKQEFQSQKDSVINCCNKLQQM